jgi:hypothetical protein
VEKLRKVENKIRKIKEETAFISRFKHEIEKMRTYAYLDWSSWSLSKEGRK